MFLLSDIQKNNIHKALLEQRTDTTESNVMLHVACFAVVDSQLLCSALEIQYVLHAQSWEGNYQHLKGKFTQDIQAFLKLDDIVSLNAWMDSEPLHTAIKAQLDFLNESKVYEILSDNELTGIKKWEESAMDTLLNDTDLPALDLNNNIVNASYEVLTLAHKVLLNCLNIVSQTT